jgi:hypothetical protein
MFVVSESDVGRDEDVVFYDYACRDEDEGSNLAIVPNGNALFDVYVGVYLGIIPDLASVQIDLVVDSRVASYCCFLDY